MPEPQRNPRRAPASPPRPSSSALGRGLYVGVGCGFVALGVVGIVVPLLPTTPFMLLAAACFARGSRRLHAWLLGSRIFGPTISDWYETRSLPRRVKATAIALIVLVLGSSTVLFAPNLVAAAALALVGVGMVVYLLRIPTRRAADAASAPGERLDVETDVAR